MLRYAEIHYFQSHKFTPLKFDPGVNIFMGASHSGKSSIVRAIKWAVRNKPRGDAFRSHFAGKEETKVILDFDDNYVIRGKGKNSNYYTINEDTFEAMRADVPPEIQEIFGMTELNIQSQHDPYFMIQDSPGTVAKKLNEILGLEIIDEKIGKANKIINQTEIDLKKAQEDEKETATELDKYKDLDKFEILIDEVEALILGYETLSAKENDLADLSAEIKGIREDIAGLEDWLTIKNKFEELELLAKEVGKLQTKYYSLKSIQNAIRKHRDTVAVQGRYRSGLEKKYNQLLKAEGVCPLCGKKI